MEEPEEKVAQRAVNLIHWYLDDFIRWIGKIEERIRLDLPADSVIRRYVEEAREGGASVYFDRWFRWNPVWLQLVPRMHRRYEFWRDAQGPTIGFLFDDEPKPDPCEDLLTRPPFDVEFMWKINYSQTLQTLNLSPIQPERYNWDNPTAMMQSIQTWEGNFPHHPFDLLDTPGIFSDAPLSRIQSLQLRFWPQLHQELTQQGFYAPLTFDLVPLREFLVSIVDVSISAYQQYLSLANSKLREVQPPYYIKLSQYAHRYHIHEDDETFSLTEEVPWNDSCADIWIAETNTSVWRNLMAITIVPNQARYDFSQVVPEDVSGIIFQQLDLKSLLRTSQVSTTWRKIVEKQSIWTIVGAFLKKEAVSWMLHRVWTDEGKRRVQSIAEMKTDGKDGIKQFWMEFKQFSHQLVIPYEEDDETMEISLFD
eukprot:TRINITY_DN6580_c0_g1_i2.p1 TRINITY_DN6580_c0_g1~~TRINITY_DN6580_c0_g1_i2.p1  ORF type:complete len:423 (-),score=61.59 TRINITY_DN6580_c0_g1_i2:84-1352(-)